MPLFLHQRFPDFRLRPLLFIDLELSGLDPDRHEILEVAALRVNQPDLTIVNSYYTKVIPLHISTSDPKSLKISGYAKKAWSDAISLRQALQDLTAFAPDCILAGWSVATELDFLVHALQAENLPYFFDNNVIEVWTLAFAKYYQQTSPDRLSLSNVCKDLGIYLDLHKPDSDIRATYEIFKKLIS
jgi:DNA polymerase III subunit epsilon